MELEVHKLPLKDFKAIKRGRVISAQPLNFETIKEVGLQINDKLQGPFELKVDSFWIEK
ncbi:MAG: CIA30 family protein [Bacteriovoracaceae bacterium]